MRKHTPGPWVWVADNAGPPDEWGCSTTGPVDIDKWRPTGYCDNAYIEGVISAGAGEYFPIDGDGQDQITANARLIAASPDMADALIIAVHYMNTGEPGGQDCRVAYEAMIAALNKAGLGGNHA